MHTKFSLKSHLFSLDYHKHRRYHAMQITFQQGVTHLNLASSASIYNFNCSSVHQKETVNAKKLMTTT